MTPGRGVFATMWPWAHLALGYLVFVVYGRVRREGWTGEAAVLALALGTQAPDLVDKTFGWYLVVLPSGRSLAHSAITGLAPVVVAWLALGRRRARRASTAFVIGYATHLVGDALYPALRGNVAELAFLAWPALPAVDYASDPGVVSHLRAMEFGPAFVFEIGLTVVAAVVWLRRGRPGLALVRCWLRRPVAGT